MYTGNAALIVDGNRYPCFTDQNDPGIQILQNCGCGMWVARFGAFNAWAPNYCDYYWLPIVDRAACPGDLAVFDGCSHIYKQAPWLAINYRACTTLHCEATGHCGPSYCWNTTKYYQVTLDTIMWGYYIADGYVCQAIAHPQWDIYIAGNLVGSVAADDISATMAPIEVETPVGSCVPLAAVLRGSDPVISLQADLTYELPPQYPNYSCDIAACTACAISDNMWCS